MIKILKSDEKIWKIYTRSEEYNPPFLDRFDRFNYCASNDENVLEPNVSKFLVENGLKIKYPKGKKFAVCLTHDIDKAFLYWKTRCYSCLQQLTKFKLKSSMKELLRKNPYMNFKEIIDIEKTYGAKSSFYIMTTNKDIFSDPLYNAKNLEEKLKFIIENGWEIGLHGGYYSYNNYDSIKKEKEKLEKIIEKEVMGYRSHFLRFKIPDTWKLLSEIGFKYDTTLGYADIVGFRNGMCHPFKPFNLNENKEIDILEIPLVIMDNALFTHMNLNFDESWQICKKLIDTVINVKGVITVLWHNTSFDEVENNEMKKLYEKILKYSYEKNGWLTSAEEIFQWWIENKNLMYKKIGFE